MNTKIEVFLGLPEGVFLHASITVTGPYYFGLLRIYVFFFQIWTLGA